MNPDLLSRALRDPGDAPLLIERDDGHTSTTDLRWWLRRETARPPGDLPALKWVLAGTAEDIGCCTGRHLQYLAGRGIAAHGIDTCEAAVTLARTAGLDADVADVHHYTPPRPVDTVLALGGGLGMAGTCHHAPAFLAHLASWLAPHGQLIVSSVDWTVTTGQHRTRAEQAQREGRYPGDVRLRLRYQGDSGDWFNWVWIDPATLESLARHAGLRITAIQRYGPAWYAASLQTVTGR
ncbi:MAG: class I SAM-dependent methyltransferase [Pseudonocardiaceae bacterium]